MKYLKTIVCLGVLHHVKTQKNIPIMNNFDNARNNVGNKINNWPVKEFISLHLNCPQKWKVSFLTVVVALRAS